MVHVLLTNCLRLLSNEPNPEDHLEIITSVHYLLAEVYSLGKENGVDDLLENGNKSSEVGGDGEKDEGFPWPKVGFGILFCAIVRSLWCNMVWFCMVLFRYGVMHESVYTVLDRGRDARREGGRKGEGRRRREEGGGREERRREGGNY